MELCLPYLLQHLSLKVNKPIQHMQSTQNRFEQTPKEADVCLNEEVNSPRQVQIWKFVARKAKIYL